MICQTCGHELRIGDFPFCKNGSGHGPYNVNVIDDQLEGGARWCETMGHEPVWIDGTKSQWRREAKARNLINAARHDEQWHAKHRKMHDEKLRDEGTIR